MTYGEEDQSFCPEKSFLFPKGHGYGNSITIFEAIISEKMSIFASFLAYIKNDINIDEVLNDLLPFEPTDRFEDVMPPEVLEGSNLE